MFEIGASVNDAFNGTLERGAKIHTDISELSKTSL